MNIGQFWDYCLNYEYDEQGMASSLDAYLKPFRGKQILYCACGTGFVVLELLKKGNNMICSDGSPAMLGEFKKHAQEKGLDIIPRQIDWTQMNKYFSEEFDLLMCRGGSITYANSWDEPIENGFENIRKSLENFYKALKLGGTLYVDVCNDRPEEINNEPIVVHGHTISLHETVHINKETRRRVWNPHLTVDGEEYAMERFSFYISDDEFEQLLKDMGFHDIKRLKIPFEFYTVFEAKK